MVTQLIYMSQPFGYDSAMLAGILAAARRNNPRHAITGALICRQDIYLQLLEGDAAAIDALYQRISIDDRHLAVTLLSRAEVPDRLFSAWAMLHDPARSWLWSVDEVAQGAVRDAGPLALQRVFERIAAEVMQDDLPG
ncbi:BLUF domain-containing protein [Sphingomonas sp. PB4P5]|uniref:BLUF domain-containing protein n=1 Tax=Parasphingomonas puruogangriensis TaxID=3096155 RepID=UPI002FC838C4